ncbi:glycosyltransferase family 2 protein [Gloeobacter kilaueensis]|uniref:Glycosyl transferase family protein n=1 Tax=Gloeobacter kilaueensis (strain ATCC BAA-2537 / CCAP 1431/1 / ULC 316 / JS1) TaxID=1183438 RepID=U5QCW3_GLOK1|nr:glycosyltransferase [Gloeobacter kilaueensis]AGY56721.1 glycosyl transferase family protein [Gloeobacter kilaueensis JS1]
MQALVSAILPAYNAEAFIARTLDSVLGQTHRELEVIVVDDGSRDRTPAIVEAYCRRDARVVLLQQKNAGVSAARNLAIAHAQGAFIAPIDADDLWYPQKIEKQLRRFGEANKAVGLVYTWTAMIDETDALTGRWSACPLEGNVWLPLVYHNFIGNASVPLIRRECLEAVGPYNLKLKIDNTQGAEDWDLYLRIAERYPFALVPEFLTGYRQLRGSMSRNYRAMETFVRLVLEGVRERQPGVPERLLRWAIADLYFNFAKSNRQANDYRASLGWLVRSALADPALLARRSYYRQLAADLLRLRSNQNAPEVPQAASLDLAELHQKVRSARRGRGDLQAVRLQKLALTSGRAT